MDQYPSFPSTLKPTHSNLENAPYETSTIDFTIVPIAIYDILTKTNLREKIDRQISMLKP